MPLDYVYENFIGELGVTPIESLLEYGSAPLCTRRDIGTMGILHRITIGIAPEQITALIWPEPHPNNPRGWRLRSCRHDKHLFGESHAPVSFWVGVLL